MIIIATLFSINLIWYSDKVNAEVEVCRTCSYAHEVDWEGVTKVVVIYEESKVETEIIKEARKRGIEVVYERNNYSYSDRDYRYFSSLYLYYRDGEGMTISVTPRDMIYPSTQDAAWSEILYYIKWHPLYLEVENSSKESSLLHQFQCHVYFAFWKKPWNLEVERPDKGFWGFVSNSCN